MSSYWLTPELIYTDENEMLFGIGNRAGRTFWGLMFAGLGLMAIVVPLVRGPENIGIELPDAALSRVAQILAAAMGLVFVIVGWVVACSVEELQLNSSVRTYLRRKGIWPFLRREGGTFDELSHLSLEPEKREYHDWAVVVWLAVLVWKEPTRERMTLFEEIDYSITDNALDRIRAQLKYIAPLLGVEIQEVAVERPAAQPSREDFLERVRQKLYGDAKARLRDQKKAAVALGLMTLGSLFVRVSGEWHIAGIIPVSGYLLWVLIVLYLAVGLLWESLKPSDASVNRSPLRILCAGLSLVAAAICLMAPALA